MVLHLLTPEHMRQAEAAAMTDGVSSFDLMTRAGHAVAARVMERFPGRSVQVLAGPGNNGGDGFIAAAYLLERGVPVNVVAVGAAKDTGDAGVARARYKGPVGPLGWDANPVIIDALLGIGATRNVEGEMAALINEVNQHRADVVAVDIPSGICAETGAMLGTAIKASFTISFAALKPGHVLLPGRLFCGAVELGDIGLTHTQLVAGDPKFTVNDVALWRARLPWPKPEQNKYHRGHVLVVGGPATHAGAAKLAAMAAYRAGAGLVSVLCAPADLPIYAATSLSLMTNTLDRFADLLADARCNTVLIGPGAGVTSETRQLVEQILQTKKRAVLDADAISVFRGEPGALARLIASPVILTPHEGEFARLFPDAPGSKLERASTAAQRLGAVMVLKGYDTIIASPDGRARVNVNATPDLATGGAGDVLAGICAGLLAQGMDAFEAASAAVWIHAEAARQHGAGLLAEDLPLLLPAVLQTLKVAS